MGFVQRFLKNDHRESQSRPRRSSFHDVSEEQLEAHLQIARYGNFELTDAVRPSYDLQVVPRAGYRHDTYIDQSSGARIPVLMAAASREHLFDLFLDLIDPLGFEVDIVLETSHDRRMGSHQDLYREHIDMPVLKSILYDFEDLLLNDGCAGVAVLNPRIPLEVQFDEHKLLIMYGQDLGEFETVLEDYGIACRESLQFITEAEHVHSSTEEHARQFEELKHVLGVEGDASLV